MMAKNWRMKIETNSPYIIAEVGVNHNGKLDLALKLVEIAKKAGADAVKFQTFTAENLSTLNAPKVEYQVKRDNSSSHFEMLKKLELKYEYHQQIIDFCGEMQIDFISTPYSLKDAKFLASLNIEIFKTASADIVDLVLHEYIASTNKIALVSTGMATESEVQTAYKVYSQCGNKQLVLLHSTSEYPAPISNSKIRRVQWLKSSFDCEVGFSDHTASNHSGILALALGARVFEKHITLDKYDAGPDHFASLSEEEFSNYVNDINCSHLALRNSYFELSDAEIQMRFTSRKSITAISRISVGDKLSFDGNIQLLRPGLGLDGRFLAQVNGRTANRDIQAGEFIRFEDLN
jgi:N,N'-diacetyllegionaminate synthase